MSARLPDIQRFRRQRADGSEVVYTYHRPTRIRLVAPEGTPEFAEEYRQAISGEVFRQARVVYFIQARTIGLVKIGLARDANSRMKELQIGCPDELVMLGWIEHPRPSAFEAALHRTFSKLRVRGEWYLPDPAILELIANAPCQTV